MAELDNNDEPEVLAVVPLPPAAERRRSEVMLARVMLVRLENMMSNSISTLPLRNLSDVFGENDPVRRRAAIDEIFHEDAVFYDPKGGVFRGRDEIDRIAGVIKATHPDFEYQPLFPPEELARVYRPR
jgi:hypothetical protein